MDERYNLRETVDGVRRCFVLKRPEHDAEGQKVHRILRELLGCSTVTTVRSVVRYDVEGIDAGTFQQSAQTIFSEAPVDELYDEEGFQAVLCGKAVIGMEALPGQYDQRADFAAQSVQVLADGDRPMVRAAQLYVLDGEIAQEKLVQLKQYLINPTDSREANHERPKTLHDLIIEPLDVCDIEGFTAATHDDLKEIQKIYGLAMTLEDLQCVQTYFQKYKRSPTVTELRVLDTYWSDHCRHTTFTTELAEIALGGKPLVRDGRWVDASHENQGQTPFERMITRELRHFLGDRETLHASQSADHSMSLMDLALFSMREAKAQGRLSDLEDSEENNAASIVVPVQFEDGRTEEWLFLFKNETHNHPTEIEPFGGAATCLGGAIRDPLSGRSYVFMAMRVSGGGDPRKSLEETMAGKLPQRRIAQTAAAGYSAYGNQIGVPSLKVTEHYHEGFRAKRFECGFVGGAVKREDIIRERPEPGDLIFLVGGRTGRDGIGGASGSSKEHDVKSMETCGAEVQKGNPPEERKLQRLFKNLSVSKLIKRCNDFGAGGVAVAVGELADGVFIHLDSVPLKYQGLDGTEIVISESQERMAVVISRNDRQAFLQIAEAENLEATQIAIVTNTNKMVMEWRGKMICRLDRSILNGGWAKRKASVDIENPSRVIAFFDDVPEELRGKKLPDQWLENLQRLEVCSQRGLQEGFDSTVGANTVVSPFGGPHQLSPSEAAVALFPADGAQTTIAASSGYDPDLAERSPFHGGTYAIVDALARLVATGADYKQARLTLQNYFEKLGNDPKRWAKPFLAQLGARMAQRELGTPAIGGKDSMSGSFTDKDGRRLDVPPTLVAFAVTPMDRRSVLSSSFQKPDSALVLLPLRTAEGTIPDWNILRRTWNAIYARTQEGAILSSHAIHKGGTAAALTEMMLGSEQGLLLETNALSSSDWFAPLYGSIIVELPAGSDPQALFPDLSPIFIGRTTQEQDLHFDGSTIPVFSREALTQSWEKPLSSVYPAVPSDLGDGRIVQREPSPQTARATRASDLAPIAHPEATVFTFPGTNCEIETARAFERAGARTRTPVFVNLTRDHIRKSIALFVEHIASSQILAFPGGFSAGDEPDGSGKFIATILRNPRISEALENFLERGGLILGICNGFQGLVKSCLLPQGKIRMQESGDPTLTHNTIGRYLSRFARHRVTSVLSPWMMHFEPGELIDFPIAHGEGRLIQLPERLWQHDQIPFQYVGMDGIARMRFPDNPNGSQESAAALTDRTGRVFGMMAHPERAMPGLSTNIPGERKGMKIFRGGVEYFSS